MPLLHMILKLQDKLTLSKYDLLVRYNRICLTSTDGQLSMKKKLLEDVKLARKKIIDVGDTWIHTKRLRLPTDIKNVIIEHLHKNLRVISHLLYNIHRLETQIYIMTYFIRK